MVFIFFFNLSLFFITINAQTVTKESLKTFFGNADITALASQWSKYSKGIETTIIKTIQDVFSKPTPNVYVGSNPKKKFLTDGFHFSDKAVDLLLTRLYLRSLPYAKQPDVDFDLADNVLEVEFGLRHVYVDTNYILFRNESAILYPEADQDPYKFSPFTFQQVQSLGSLTITAEECRLRSTIIALLKGPSVSLRHDVTRVSSCQFQIEAYTPGDGSPPVIAPYFSKEKREELMRLIAKPIRDELVAKLQGIVFSHINSTRIFKKKLAKYLSHQAQLLTTTNGFLSKLTSSLNEISAKQKDGAVKLQDLNIFVYENCTTYCNPNVSITDVTLYGLDTAYSSQNGGAYSLIEPNNYELSDSIRFNNIQLVGNLTFEKADTIFEDHTTTTAFAVDIEDVAVDVIFNFGDNSLQVKEVLPAGWRFLEMSIYKYGKIMVGKYHRRLGHTLISAYVSDRVPEQIAKHLTAILPEALKNNVGQPKPWVEQYSDYNDDYGRRFNQDALNEVLKVKEPRRANVISQSSEIEERADKVLNRKQS